MCHRNHIIMFILKTFPDYSIFVSRNLHLGGLIVFYGVINGLIICHSLISTDDLQLAMKVMSSKYI
jgi:hypothetical protein